LNGIFSLTDFCFLNISKVPFISIRPFCCIVSIVAYPFQWLYTSDFPSHVPISHAQLARSSTPSRYCEKEMFLLVAPSKSFAWHTMRATPSKVTGCQGDDVLKCHFDMILKNLSASYKKHAPDCPRNIGYLAKLWRKSLVFFHIFVRFAWPF
jgi:hypothetical protein